MWIFVALVVVPIIEIALFIELGGWIGLWPTIAIVIATAVAGAALLRSQGFRTISELQRRVDGGEDPTPLLAHGALILVAGIVLLTPGFFTDAVGFALLIPPVRAAVIAALARRIHVMPMGAGLRRNHPSQPPGRPGDVPIETAYEDVTADERPTGPSDRPSKWHGGPGGSV